MTQVTESGDISTAGPEVMKPSSDVFSQHDLRHVSLTHTL